MADAVRVAGASAGRPRPALRLVKTQDLSRGEWLAVRKGGIGSSDAAAAVGLNPYKSQLQLWMEKTGRDGLLPQVDPADDTSPMYWGTLLEPIVAAHYTRRTGHRVRRVNAVLQHPARPWMLANPDREVVGARDVQILECKTAGLNGARLWKDGVPEYVQLQVLHQLAVTGKQAADVATTEMTGISADRSSGVQEGGRALSAIAADHAKVVAALASANARSCRGDCPGLKARKAALAAPLEALDVEAQEARRRQAAEDRHLQAQQRLATRRDAARHDPVMSTLAAWLGGTPLRIELLGALVLAAALEGVACYGWFLVLVARPGVVSEPVTHGPIATDTELGRVQRAIANGQIRPTVVEIRRHLGCSQAKALQLRRQLAA